MELPIRLRPNQKGCPESPVSQARLTIPRTCPVETPFDGAEACDYPPPDSGNSLLRRAGWTCIIGTQWLCPLAPGLAAGRRSGFQPDPKNRRCNAAGLRFGAECPISQNANLNCRGQVSHP